MRSRHLLAAVTATSFAAALVGLVPARAQVQEPVLTAAQREKAPLLDTLKELVSIESGSRDLEGLARLADLIAGRLNALGGEVELIDVSGDMYRMEDTPERVGKVVQATFRGTGSRKILLIAHMDTVYQRGMLAAQPFTIEGNQCILLSHKICFIFILFIIGRFLQCFPQTVSFSPAISRGIRYSHGIFLRIGTKRLEAGMHLLRCLHY